MSTIAISATFAAVAVSPPKLFKREAEKLVTCSMYSLADTPTVLNAASAFFLTTPASPLNNVSTPPMLCSRLAPSLTAPPTMAVVAVTAAIVTGITTDFVRLFSVLPIADIPFAVASFIFTTGANTFPPIAFSFPVTFEILALAASLSLIMGVVAFFATPLIALFIFFTFEVAASFTLITGVTTFLPTALTPLLTLAILVLAASFARITGDATFFPNCFTFPVKPSVFLTADEVSSFAVYVLSQVRCSSFLVFAASFRRAVCSALTLFSTELALSRIEILPTTPI